MQRTFLDFETYYDDVYSLKRMTPIEYVMDQRFEALGCAFIHEGKSREWVDGPDLPKYFQTIDWPNTFSISHNTLFDGLILAMRYGIRPGFYGDTLAMARNWLSHSLSSIALGSVAEYFGLPAKWGTLAKTKGVNFHQLAWDPALHEEVKGYALDDAGKCRTIFNNIMLEGFPPGQLEIIDWVCRMATEPVLKLDKEILHQYLAEVKQQKQALLDTAMIDSKAGLTAIMSDPQLATKLLFLGVEVPMKVSKGTGKLAYAFAKTDKDFTELLEHENPMVQALVAARLGHKSTIEETRTERLIAISRVTDVLPVPLKFSGAHTHRLSGDWKINLQNLQTGGQLRKAVVAPKGMKVVVVDASQIEARLNATLSGQEDLVSAFRQGRDVYAEFAEDIYHYNVTKEREPRERFVGKTGILSLGFGSSAPVFQAMCRNKGDIILTDSESTSIVFLYRQRFKQIVENWKYANNSVLPRMAGMGGEAEVVAAGIMGQPVNNMWGPLQIVRNAIILPNGNRLRYRDLKRELVDGNFQWTFMRGAVKHKIYGAKLVENVIQALDFVFVSQVAMRVKTLTNGLLLPKHQVHDDLIYVVEDRHAEPVRELVMREMSTPPEWMPNLPVAAEGHIGQSYYDAK